MLINKGALLLEAAIDGQGIALTQWTLVQEDITARRLVALFDFSVPSEPGYYLVCPEATSNVRKVAVFREWLLGEAKLWADKIAARRESASQPTLDPI